MSIKENISEIMKNAADNVVILAATKTRSIQEIKQAIDSGIRIIGENYVQEAKGKYESIKEYKKNIEIHCIGHLQKNKVKKSVELFDMIQTVDSVKIANEIDKECGKIKKTMPVLIEVNIAEEENKDGCMPKDVLQLADEISKLDNLKLKGLMTMGPFVGTVELKPYFKKAKEMFDKLKKKYLDIDTLSMGMSDSYKAAVEEGASMIRVGTGIFGKRK